MARVTGQGRLLSYGWNCDVIGAIIKKTVTYPLIKKHFSQCESISEVYIDIISNENHFGCCWWPQKGPKHMMPYLLGVMEPL